MVSVACAPVQVEDHGGLAEWLAAPHRSARNVARDEFRHLLETLAFFGIRDGSTVVEILPGSVLGVVDHRGRADLTQEAQMKSGYVREDYAIALIEKAGFKLAGRSEVNANPKDTKDHPEGVWTLPPTYRLKDRDRAKYAAIGESDRFTLKFVKQ